MTQKSELFCEKWSVWSQLSGFNNQTWLISQPHLVVASIWLYRAQKFLPLCSGDKRLVLAHTLLCLFSSSELRAGGPPPGTRPAEDEAGRHAAGRPGPDLTPERHGGHLAQSLPSAPSFSLSGTRLTARACQPLSCLLRQRQPAGSSKLTNQHHPEKRRWHDPGGLTSVFTERNNVHNRAQMLEGFLVKSDSFIGTANQLLACDSLNRSLGRCSDSWQSGLLCFCC